MTVSPFQVGQCGPELVDILEGEGDVVEDLILVLPGYGKCLLKSLLGIGYLTQLIEDHTF